jgi:hypothetical protein
MVKIEESVEIKVPAEKAFAYTTEAKRWPEWQSFIVEAEQTSQGQVGIGTTFKGKNRMMGLTMKWIAKVTEYDPNTKWAKNIICGGMIINEHVTYDPIEAGIKFTIVYDMNIGGFLKLFSPMIVSSMRKETKKSLLDLKGILEA